MSAIWDNSLVVRGVRGADRWIGQVYAYSKTHYLFRVARATLFVWFRYSFLGRITELNGEAVVSLAVWQNSYVVHRLLRGHKRAGVILTRDYNNSSLAVLVRSLQGGFRGSPALSLGIILTVAIFVNSGLSLALGREIRAWGWFLRVMFLFSGICFLLYRGAWGNLIKGSVLANVQQST